MRYYLMLFFLCMVVDVCPMNYRRIPQTGAFARSFELCEAVFADDRGRVFDLLRAGANVNFRPERGLTPLLWAIWYDNLAMVRLLCELGADLNLTDNDGRTASICASLWGRCEILKYLLDKSLYEN